MLLSFYTYGNPLSQTQLVSSLLGWQNMASKILLVCFGDFNAAQELCKQLRRAAQ